MNLLPSSASRAGRGLARLWPLWLFLAAAVVALCVFAPALPQALVLQGPDGQPNLTRPGLWRRAAEWAVRGTPCLNHDELLKLLLPSLAFHELSYVLSAGLVALGIGVYLRLLGLPLAACFGGGLAMAFSGYHFTLFNAGHRGYASMVVYAAWVLPLLETAVRRPRAAWAAFPLLGVCAVCGLSTQPDVMTFLLLLEIAYGVFRVAQLARAEGARAFLAPRWKPWLAGAAVALVAFGAFGWSTMRHVFGTVVAGREAQMEASGAGEATGDAADDPESAKAAARERWIFATNWSLPPEDLPEFVAPNLHGLDTGWAPAPYWGGIGRSEGWETTGQGFANFRQHSIYLGAIGVAFALFAVVGAFCDLRRKARNGVLPPAASAATPLSEGGGREEKALRATSLSEGGEKEEKKFRATSLSEGGGKEEKEFRATSLSEGGTSPGLTLFWAVAALVALLLALGRFGFLYRLFYHLPMMDKVRAPVKFVHLAEVCVSILFAFGLARLGREPGRRERLAAKISIPLLALAAAALGGMALGFDPEAHAKILAAIGVEAGSAAARELARLRAAGPMHGAWLFALAAGAIALGAFLRTPRRAVVARCAAWALAAVAALDLAVVARGYVRTDDVSARYAPSAPSVDLLKRHPEPDGHTYSYLQLAGRPLPGLALQVPFGAIEEAGFALGDPTANDDPATSLRVQSLRTFAGDPARLWAYWGTAAVFLPREAALPFVQAGVARVAGLYDFAPGMRLVRAADLRTAPVAMLEPEGVPPAVAVYHGWRGVAENASPADVFAALSAPGFDLRRELVLGDYEPGEVHPATHDPEPAEWVVLPSANQGRRAVVRCSPAEKDGVLLVRENRMRWFPEVRVRLNGEPHGFALRAGGQFLAVRGLPAGPCEVELEPVVPWRRYRLPALGWIAALALLVLWARRAFAANEPAG